MNKLKLIQALRDATELTKPEAEKVVTVFFNDMAAALAKGVGWRSGIVLVFRQGMRVLHRAESENRTAGIDQAEAIAVFLGRGKN
jgi:hypothetical protein